MRQTREFEEKSFRMAELTIFSAGPICVCRLKTHEMLNLASDQVTGWRMNALVSELFSPHFCFIWCPRICHAKHVKDKAAKWAKAKRPRKSRPSDINRTPIVYEIHSIEKPAEYSISDEPAAPMAKPEN